MKLDNFKELLLKKSGDNPNLQLLIKYMREDYLVDHVVESLEKMAAAYSKKNPNASVLHFAKNMNKFKSGMIHDALSHHASHYKAALNAGNEALADKHMGQIFKVIHMTEKFTKDGINDRSDGKLKIEAVDPKPWERSKYDSVNEATKKFKTDTRGWGRHGSDYSWLRGTPHESYKGEISKHGHNKAYPLEEIKVNGKYIHIDDNIEHDGNFNSHPFDSHPIHKHYSTKPSNHGSEQKQAYLDARESFHNDEGGGKALYRDKLANMSKEDYANIGKEKAAPVHKDIEGLDVSTKPKTQPSVETQALADRLKAIREMRKK